MQIANVSQKFSPAFSRAFTSAEMQEYKQVMQAAKGKIGQTGMSVLIVHDPCLPQSQENNTGMAALGAKNSQDFFQYMKDYLVINTIETLPPGEPHEIKHHGNYYNPYKASALSLSPHYIDLNFLTQKNFGEILTKKEIAEVISANNNENKEYLANFKNVILDESPHNLALKKAFTNFLKLDENSSLKKEFENYKKENSDWLLPKALYKALSAENATKDFKKWQDLDKNLLDKKNETNNKRIEYISKKYNHESEFYYFKQFLAEKSLQLGRKMLNKKGLKLYSDMLVNFSGDEVWANKKAFDNDFYIANPKWRIPSLNFKDIYNPDSPVMKLLKRKTELFAKRFDGIRIDVSWGYTKPKLVKKDLSKTQYPDLGSKIYELFEETVKSVQKENYRPENIIHEAEAGIGDFSLFDGNGNVTSSLKDRVKIFTQEYLNNDWASYENLVKERNINENGILLGATNHDCNPIKNIALAHDPHGAISDGDMQQKKDEQILALSKIFQLPSGNLKNPVEFVRAKFAESMGAKNHMLYVTDVFGRSENLNPHAKKTEQSFRFKIPANYKEAYHKAVQSGFGFNLPDAIEKIFRKKGLDKTDPELHNKIIKYANILYAPD